MTRINVVPVEELCDKHLRAEFREITRIPNCVARGRYNLKGAPDRYTLGKGHVKFFYTRLAWLRTRYIDVYEECLRRGFNMNFIWPDYQFHYTLYNGWRPTEEALRINRQRIKQRMPKNAKFTRRIRW